MTDIRVLHPDGPQPTNDAERDAITRDGPRVQFALGQNPDGSPDGTATVSMKRQAQTIVMHGLTVQDVRETWADTGHLLDTADANSDPEG